MSVVGSVVPTSVIIVPTLRRVRVHALEGRDGHGDRKRCCFLFGRGVVLDSDRAVLKEISVAVYRKMSAAS